MEGKNNKVILILAVILFLLVVGLGGYIIYDKVLKEPAIVENNDNDDSNNTSAWGYTREITDNMGTIYNLNLNKLSPNKIEYEIVDSENTKLLGGEETWSAELKDFEVVIAQKIDSTDKDYKCYVIEYKDAFSNAKLEIVSINVNTNSVNQIILINNNTKKIDYYINLKGTEYETYDEYINPNQIAFRYAYGQNAKIDSWVDKLRQQFPYYFKTYGDKNMLVYIELSSNRFEIIGIPEVEPIRD